jgi:hypothetical protein
MRLRGKTLFRLSRDDYDMLPWLLYAVNPEQPFTLSQLGLDLSNTTVGFNASPGATSRVRACARQVT